MSSPFTIFRRHQRVLLACVGVLAMIAFVFLPNVSSTIGSRTRDDAVVVDTAHFGPLHESDLMNLNGSRELVKSFLIVLADTLAHRQVEQFQVNESFKNQLLNSFTMQKRGELLQIMNLSNDEIMDNRRALGDRGAVETFVLSKSAEAAGIVVSDATINDFLSHVIGDAITREQLAKIIGSLGSRDNPISQKRLFQALRIELLANEYRNMFIADLRPVTPGQQWDYYLRANQRATIEALALPVTNFVAEVSRPSEQELRKLYVKHRDELPLAQSPDPGFKEPKKVVVQYFMANVDDMIRRAEAEVTEPQIVAYYEKNKATQFRKTTLPPESGSGKPTSGAANGEAPSSETKPAEAMPDETKPAETKPADAKPADAKPAEPAAESKPAETKPAEPSPPESKPAEPAPKSGASARFRATIRLVNADEKATSGDSAPADKPADKPAAPAEKPPATDSAPASDKPAAEPPAEKPADQTSEKPAPDKPSDQPAPVEYEPLDKVRDAIRTSIARENTANQLFASMDALQKLMAEYADQRLDEEPQDDAAGEGEKAGDKNSSSKAKKPAGPAPLDFAALAKQYGFEAHEMGPISAQQANDDTNIGRSIPSDPSLRGQNFISLTFGDGLGLYAPLRTSDAHREFLSWKTRVESEHVPTFEQAKPKVEQAWKFMEARKLAEKKAKEYMAEARREKKSLEALFGKQPELRVLKPAPFSWITFGPTPRENEPPQPRFGVVEGVDIPGEAFMRAVFHLSPDDYTVTTNNPQTTVFVVHLLEFDRSLDTMLTSFGQDKDPRYKSLANFDREKIYRGWIEGLLQEAGVEWRRDPRERRR